MPVALLVIAALLIGGLPLAAGGGTIRVPEDYSSVLEAVDAASAGDSVLVGPGTWSDWDYRWVVFGGQLQLIGSTAFLKPGVTVIGLQGAKDTVLDAEGADFSILHVDPGTIPSRLEGLTITGPAFGLGASGSSLLELTNCWIVENARVGILADDQSLSLTDCVLTGNEHNSPVNVHGAIDGDDIDLDCIRCTFVANHGAAVHIDYGRTVALRDCLIADHQIRGMRFLFGVNDLLVENSVFLRNSVSSGGGGAIHVTDGVGDIRFCTFAYDSSGNGGALEIVNSDIRIENNTFYRCHGDPAAGAIALSGTNAEAVNNIFAGSTGQRGAVRKTGGPTHPDTDCNLFWDNEGGDYFGDWVPGPNDVYADPQFCDEIVGDFLLRSTSPAAPANSPICGLIGAFGVGCGVVSTERESWGRIKMLYRGGTSQEEER